MGAVVIYPRWVCAVGEAVIGQLISDGKGLHT